MKIALIRGVVTIAELSNLDFQRLKNISGLRWNRTTRCMVGPASLNLLDGLARYYKLPADMETKRQSLGKTRREIDAERLAEDPTPLLPYPVKANLYKHQIRGANMALRAFGALDAKTPGGGFGELFEMGCGKTITTIAVAGALYNLGKIDRVLVVAPTSVCSVWPHDLNQFAAFPWEARVYQQLAGGTVGRYQAENQRRTGAGAPNRAPGLRGAALGQAADRRRGRAGKLPVLEHTRLGRLFNQPKHCTRPGVQL